MAKPDLEAKLAVIGFGAKPSSPEGFGNYVAAGMAAWAALAKDTGIEAQ